MKVDVFAISEVRLVQLQKVSQMVAAHDFSAYSISEMQALISEITSDPDLADDVKQYCHQANDILLDQAYCRISDHIDSMKRYLEVLSASGTEIDTACEITDVIWHQAVPKGYRYSVSNLLSRILFASHLFIQLSKSCLWLKLCVTAHWLEQAHSLDLVERYQVFEDVYQSFVQWCQTLRASSYIWQRMFRSVIQKLLDHAKEKREKVHRFVHQKLSEPEYAAALLMQPQKPELSEWLSNDQWSKLISNQLGPSKYWSRAFKMMAAKQDMSIEWDDHLMHFWLQHAKGNPAKYRSLLKYLPHRDATIINRLLGTMKIHPEAVDDAFLAMAMQHQVDPKQFQVECSPQTVVHMLENQSQIFWSRIPTLSLSNLIRNFSDVASSSHAYIVHQALSNLYVILALGWGLDVLQKAKAVWQSIGIVLQSPPDTMKVKEINEAYQLLSNFDQGVEKFDEFLSQLIACTWPKYHTYDELYSMCSSPEGNWPFWHKVHMELLTQERKDAGDHATTSLHIECN